MPNTLSRKQPFEAELVGLGLAFAVTAQYVRAWPYPHWASNIVFGLWLVSAALVVAGWPSMQRLNRSLTVPTAGPAKEQYRRRLNASLVGNGLFAVFFLAPFAVHWMPVGPSMKAVILVAGWTASVAIVVGLMGNRRAWIQLMSPASET